MTGHVCPQCGARYGSPDDSCAQRFAALLALDHSRTEPWGSRHGSAFAAYTLQHPAGQTADSLERCWALLYLIWTAGNDPGVVVQEFRRVSSGAGKRLNAPPLPPNAAEPKPFPVTIADLGEFDAAEYPALLGSWCRTTLETIGNATDA